MGISKTTFKIRIKDLVNTKGISPKTKEKIKDELSEFVIDKILKDTGNRRSSVSGRMWTPLKPKSPYKKMKSKIAKPVANLELHGDMLDTIKHPEVYDIVVDILTS